MITPTEIDILHSRIEIAQRRGNGELLATLRRQLAEHDATMTITKPATSHDAAMDTNIAAAVDAGSDVDDEECYTTALGAFSPKIKRALVTYGVYDLDSLAEWDFARLSLIPSLSRRDVVQVFATLNALQMGSVIGSAGNVDHGLPDKNPYAIDHLEDRSVDDVTRYLRMLADGVPQREVSQQMGSNFGWHQRAQSLADRHSLVLCGLVRDRFKEAYRGAMWWREASIEQTPDRPRRHWRLRIDLRCTTSEAVKQTGAAENRKRGGYSWRSADVVFVEGQ